MKWEKIEMNEVRGQTDREKRIVGEEMGKGTRE